MNNNTPTTLSTGVFRKGRIVFSVYLIFMIFIAIELLSMSGYDVPTDVPISRYMTNAMYSVNGTTLATVTNSDTSKHVNPHNYSYIILERDICRPDDDIFLLVVVCVAPARFEHRETIRNTWGSVAIADQQVRMIFILGKVVDRALQEKINNESKTFHDIVQEDFIDSYQNLSLKTVALLKWTSLYCDHSKYVLKADDDMFININYLIGVLKDRKPSKSIVGFQIVGARPIRDSRSKWYAPTNLFAGNQYPTYVSGTAYVISTDIVSNLFAASLNVPLFWLEDVYVTGLCRIKIKASVVNDWGFTYSKVKPSGCVFKSRVSGHQYTLEEMRKIWSEFNNKSLIC